MAAACRVRRIPPRFLATGGLFRAPIVGPVMRHWGHIPVHRGSSSVTQALPDATQALAAGSVVLVYPEGGIGLDPGMWPERGKTGTARLALSTGATVVPVAQWGAHEVVPYSTPRGLLRALPKTLWRRPVIQVRFGEPVDLSDLRGHEPRDAQRATDRIMAAITRTLSELRADEPDRPRRIDPTRPIRAPVRSRDQPPP
jgi:1-acyl-sn-glycerol-3-phosphate acyltransferase